MSAEHPLPDPGDGLPANTPASIRRFWRHYWIVFFLMLPWLVLRQCGVYARNLAVTVFTWNRSFEPIRGLELVFINTIRSLGVSTLFGERFIAVRYKDILLDPGPRFGAKRMQAYGETSPRIDAIIVSHPHEEHIGNAPLMSRRLGVPLHGTAETLAALRAPEPLSLVRRTFIGQPVASNPDTQKLGPSLRTSRAVVDVIASPGHCAGHVSLYDRDERILFAGDSYLQADFTSPNGEVDAEACIETLERYRRLDIETMVGSHGVVFSVDPRVSHRPFVTSRRDPKALIERKYQFLRWATARVRLAESMGLPYRVIEASLFPWSQPWSGQNWFIDETIRLFSGGEFSRTHFLRSLTRQRDRVPARFPYWARIGRWVAQRLSSLRTMTPSSSANSRSPGVKTTL